MRFPGLGWAGEEEWQRTGTEKENKGGQEHRSGELLGALGPGAGAPVGSWASGSASLTSHNKCGCVPFSKVVTKTNMGLLSVGAETAGHLLIAFCLFFLTNTNPTWSEVTMSGTSFSYLNTLHSLPLCRQSCDNSFGQ